MTLDRIESWIAAGESETLEFKKTTGARREAARTVCAMLNQHGGHVVFGISDETKAVGQHVGAGTMERVGDELQRIDPPTYPTIERLALTEDRDLIVVSVSPGPAKPYQYRGVAYRRVGSTTRAMPAEEYNRVLVERIHGELRWENQPAGGWAIRNLDSAEIRRTVDLAVRRGRLDDPGTREPEELLRGLRLYRGGQLTRAAAVLFGDTEPLEFDLPQCLLRVARFRGADRMEFLDNRQFHGNAFALLRTAERYLRETLPIPARFEPDRFERIDEPLVPPLATREERGMDDLSERQRNMLALMERVGEPMALREIRARLEPLVELWRLRKDLATLKSRGLVASSGHGRGARWRRL